jgi:hypothetical protein
MVLYVEEYGFNTSRYYMASDTMSLHQSGPWRTALFLKVTVNQHVKYFSPYVESGCSLPFSKELSVAVND